MANETKLPFEVPAEMRAAAERSITEARQAFDRIMEAAKSGIGAAEGHGRAVQEGARDVNATVIGFAEQNIASAFEYAQKLMQAKDPQTLMQLQIEFIKTQMQGLSEQAQVLGEAVTKAASGVVSKK
jgi:phasin